MYGTRNTAFGVKNNLPIFANGLSIKLITMKKLQPEQLLLSACALLPTAAIAQKNPSQKPNIVVINIDDMVIPILGVSVETMPRLQT